MTATEGVLNELPCGWTWTKLEFIAEKINPGFPSGRHNKEKRGILHIRPMNISPKGEIDLSNVKYVETLDYDSLSKGDVLFNNTNSPEMLGKTTYLKRDTNWAYSNHMTRIKLFQQFLEPAWVAYYLHHLFLNGFFKMNCVHHVNQASINSGFLSQRIPIPLAPLPEQHRIVARIEELFSHLDAGVEALQKAKAQLRRYRQSVLKAAVEGRLTEEWRKAHPEVESAENLLEQITYGQQGINRIREKNLEDLNISGLSKSPKNWLLVKISDVGYVQLGRQRAPRHHFGEHMRPYLRVANVFENRIDTSDILMMNFTPSEFKTYQLHYGDILLNEGQSLELIGRPAIYRDELPGSCFQNTLVRFTPFKGVDPEYSLCVFRSYFHNGMFQKIAKWTTTMAHLGAGRFSNLPFPLPPLFEQKEIASEISRIESVVENTETSIDSNLKRTGRLRQSILKRAFEGGLVPQDPNDEPASMLLERIKAERSSQVHNISKRDRVYNAHQTRLIQ